MKTLARFLANHLLDRHNFDEEEWPSVLTEYTELIIEGIEAYKRHLQNDSPKTVHWAMIEKDLITALERMQCQDNLGGARHNNQSVSVLEKICLQPVIYQDDYLGCVNCKSILACTNRENRHCEECLLFNLESQGNCEEPGYGTKADNNACDRFKLNVNNQICPLNMYFEGDEDKIDLSKCDFENRSCSEACKINKCGNCGQFSKENIWCLQGTRKVIANSKACKSFYKEN